MATVILVRHGRTTANASGVLAGRTAGVRLDETGAARPPRTAERLAVVPLVAVGHQPAGAVPADGEGDPGAPRQGTVRAPDRARASPSATTASGRAARSRTWPRSSSGRPSRPSRRPRRSRAASRWSTMQARAVSAVRRRDALVEAEHGAGAVWVAVSHGDVIKSILADALGHAPRPLPAAPRRPGLGLDHPLHRDPALRAGDQHPRRRPVLAGPAAGRRRARRSRRAARRRGRRGAGPSATA